MHIAIEHHNDQFNVNLSSKEGAEAFLSIKGCRIASGREGEFVSYPATKNQSTDKWWRHVWASDKFSHAVLEKYHATKPQRGAGRAQRGGDDYEDAPF